MHFYSLKEKGRRKISFFHTLKLMLLKLIGVGMGGRQMLTSKKFENHYLKAQRRILP